MKNKDLNLLVIFDAIMTEQSITRAAERLHLTQPAVSNAVKRMRERWNDDLFARNGRDIQPTSYALNLWQQIQTPLQELETATNQSSFDPCTAARTFRICSITDASVDYAWRGVRKKIESEAFNIRVHTFPYHEDEIEEDLTNDKVDLVVGSPAPRNELISSAALFVPEYICLMRSDHPLARGPMNVQDFASADHLMVTSASCVVSDLTDQALARFGLSREIATTVHHLAAVPQMVLETSLIALIPASSIRNSSLPGELIAVDPPLALTPDPISLIWHKRRESDLGLTWLRAAIAELVLSVEESVHMPDGSDHDS